MQLSPGMSPVPYCRADLGFPLARPYFKLTSNFSDSSQQREANVMSKEVTPIPSEINLHQKSRVLEITFDNGKHFELPCEYLRVYSPSAENRIAAAQGDVPLGKEFVNITEITPIGQYAVRLRFDDGHTTGVYSWEALYELGENQAENWRDYLEKLDKKGYQRREHEVEEAAPSQLTLHLLYFVKLVNLFGRQEEEITVPSASAGDVRGLLAWLRRRGGDWEKALAEDQVQVTINKQFASLDSRLRDRDEIGIVPFNPA